MSSLSANTKHTYATQPHTGDKPDKLETKNMVMLIAIETSPPRLTTTMDRKGKRPTKKTRTKGTFTTRIQSDSQSRTTIAYRHTPTASTLTSQAVTRFEEQPGNNIQPLDVRVMEYPKSSPAPPRERKRSSSEQRRQMTGSMKDWSDQWHRLERE